MIDDEHGELRGVPPSVGQARHMSVGRRYRLIALEDCDVLEVSTSQRAGTVAP